MKHFLIFGAFLLGAALIAPVAMTAEEHHDRRYYDREGHDYHVYNSQEDRAYRVYLGEQHRDYRELRRENRARQQQYFRWRHTHPDHVLVQIR